VPPGIPGGDRGDFIHLRTRGPAGGHARDGYFLLAPIDDTHSHAMTDELPNLALLPAGLRDLLPPEAETEASAVEALMDVFAAHGYQRVKPPLLEFEDSLLAGSGAAVAEQTFRLMDPDSQRMMGMRADTTPQVARIAATRLTNAPRPLRLSYAGQCLRVRGSQIAPDRQIGQAGIELIGHDSPEADAEIILVAAEALAAVGLDRISFDLTLPMLTPTLVLEALTLGDGLLESEWARLLRDWVARTFPAPCP